MTAQIVSPSGLYYPNKIARMYLQGVEEVIGKAALHNILREYGLDLYIESYPPDNYNRAFDFADFSMINAGVSAFAGSNEALKRKVGAASYARGLKDFGSFLGLGGVSLAFQVLPLKVKIRMGMQTMAGIFSTFTDQTTEVHEHENGFDYRILKCPICWGRHGDHPDCSMGLGLLKAGLDWISEGQQFEISETGCRMLGDDACVYRVILPIE